MPSEAWKEVEEHAEELAARKGIPRSQLHSLLEEIRREVTTEVIPGNHTRKEQRRFPENSTPMTGPS